MDVVNPATGERIDTVQADGEPEIEAALERAASAFEHWRARPLRERTALLEDLAGLLRERSREYGALITREMGKPITQAEREVEKCAWVCDHYARNAAAYLADDYHAGPAGATVRTQYEPLGAVLAVMPWNFPFWQVFRFAAPYVTAGDVGLLKHASNVPGCAQAIEQAFRDAGYPEGVFQSLLISSDLVDDVLEDDCVRAATLTGSSGAGRAVASTAGEQLKKTVLELGGSDPFVVLDDADVEEAAETGAWARNLNGGQSCIAAKRFVVHEAVYEQFRDRFLREVESYDVGDPTDEDTDVGPQASEELAADLHDQVRRSVEDGAEVLIGGEPLDREGSFYPPTVLEDVPEDSPAAKEEVFGPVATLTRVRDEQEAVDVANDTDFGLGASIWTDDRERGERLAGEIEAGCVYVNQLVKSDPRVPFGGIGDSGYGRELAEPGIQEFVNRKTVWVE